MVKLLELIIILRFWFFDIPSKVYREASATRLPQYFTPTLVPHVLANRNERVESESTTFPIHQACAILPKPRLFTFCSTFIQ